ncbi:MAG: hypothetical protein K0S65_4081 [Labilithrix sp.]|nr:hypothetical protein [Labilithrix sp.]
MHLEPHELLITVAAVALAWMVVEAIRRWWRRGRLRRRFARARDGEREAIALLEGHGFEIEGAQVSAGYTVEVDGSPFSMAVRADYVVVRGRHRFVAEVKTGRVAPRLDHPATRRQLLEYQHAFDVAGVVLVDADTRTVQVITFALNRSKRPSLALAFAAVIVVAALLVWFDHVALSALH